MLIYAIREDDGKRILVEIQCDGCGATIKPAATDSGWTKTGVYPRGDTESQFWCPNCSRER